MANKKVLEIVVKDKATPAVKKVDKALKNTSKQAVKTSKTASKSVNSLNDSLAVMPGPIQKIITGFKMLKVALISTGIGAIVVAAGALTGLFIAATAKGAEFSKQMSGLKAVLGEKGTTGAMKQLAQSAKDLGASTQFTATEVAGLQTEYAKLGKTVPEILSATEATLDLAASLEVDLASAATLAGSTVNSFGLLASDTQRVVDVLAKSTSSSSLDFGLLTESLKMAAPIARATGKSIEETAGLLGVLADNGVKGSLAGTGLSKVMSELNKQGLTFKEAYDKVNSATNRLGTAQKLVGEIGAKSLLNLASSEEAINKLTTSLENSEGAAKAMAEIKMDNLAGDTTKLSSAWDGFLLTLEDGNGIFMDLSRFAVQALTKIVTKITKVSRIFSAFFAELNASTGFLDTAGVAFDLWFLNIENGLLLLKKTISKVPYIGKAIDKKQLEKDLDAVKNTYAELTKEAIKIAEESEARRQQGTFSERMQARIKASIDQEYAEKKEKIDAEVAAKEDEKREERLEKQKAALEKYLAFKNKLENRQEDFDDKTEEQKLSRQKERDLKALNSIKVSKTKKREAELLIEKLYDGKFKELAAKRTAEAKRISDAKDVADQAEIDKAQKLKDKADADEIKKQEKQWNMLQKLQNTAQEQELLELAQQYDAKILLAEGNAELMLALNEQQKIDEAAIDDKYNAERLAASNKISQKEIDDAQKVKDAKIASLQQLFNATSSALNSLGQLAGEGTKTQKAAALAGILIDTASGISSAIAGATAAAAATGPAAPVVTPILIAQMVGQVLTGMVGAKAVLNKVKGGGSVAGITAPSLGGSGGTSPSQAPNFNVVGQSGFNQVASALGTQQPVQAYVVAGNVTTAQQLANNTIQTATF